MDQFFKINYDAKFPQYEDYEVRYLTFSGWNNPKNPHELVKSGFTFIGGKDNVQCFYCGVILNNWERADDVDFCHKTSSPNCYYLKNKTHYNDRSTQTLLSNILIQLRDLKIKVWEIKEMINPKSEDIEEKPYRLFEGIQMPEF